MMNLRVVAVFLLLSIGSSAASRLQPEFQIHITPKTHVRIDNVFTDGSSFTVHCNSRGDDLGEQVVNAGQTYEFVFYPNIWFTTRYFCRFSAPQGSMQIDVYRAVRDMKRCYKNCVWTVSENDVLGLNMIGIPDIVYTWNT